MGHHSVIVIARAVFLVMAHLLGRGASGLEDPLVAMMASS